MICNSYYLADILRVCEIKDLIWVMRFQSPLVYVVADVIHGVFTVTNSLKSVIIRSLTLLLLM